MPRFEEELVTILDLAPTTIRTVITRNKLNIPKLRNIMRDKQAWKRRDEFYSLFKSEETADSWWERFMDNYFLENNEIVLDKELPR